MEEQFMNQAENEVIKLNLDEFDLDSFELKPINKGLGFHEDDKKQSIPSQVAKKVATRSRHSQGQAPKLTGNAFLQNSPQALPTEGLMSGVEAIYGNRSKENIKTSQTRAASKEVKTKIAEASLASVFAAFVLDFLLISTTTLLLLSSFYLLVYKSITLDALAGFISDSAMYALVFFCLSYLSYFSLLEPVGTWGKKAFSLKLIQTSGEKRATIRQSFMRALVSLMSLALMGIPLVLDFHGKLSDTKVVR